ncbi:hypothetical protein, partial [Thiolapillus sp.]|uniref:hypothetical protein n=1 Tax=Thiolapillus sp. TaxID=2017437 RepID=UPI003AF76196
GNELSLPFTYSEQRELDGSYQVTLIFMNPLATPMMEKPVSVGRTSVRHFSVVAVVGLKPDGKSIAQVYFNTRV